MRFFTGFIVGAIAMALFAYRKQISDIVHNRKALSAGAKTAEGLGQVVEGAKELWEQL